MRSSSRRTFIAGNFLALVGLLAMSAVAAANPPDSLARVGFLSGPVSFRPAAAGQWTVATLNDPLTTGDDLRTDATGRAELQLRSSVVRIAANTSLTILNLDTRVTRIRLAQGTVSMSVRDIDPPLGDVIEVDTPNSAVSLRQQGYYRIDVSRSGDETTVSVRHGTASVTSGDTVFGLGESGAASIAGVTAPTFSQQAVADIDEWDDWCQWRERRMNSAIVPVPATMASQQAAELAARQAEERVDLEARHATEMAQLVARQQEELRQAADERERQQLRKRQEREKSDLDLRQIREHVQMELRHDKETRQTPVHEAS